MKHAKQYFDKHKTIDLLYCTSDDLLFQEMHEAESHASTLDDDIVIPLTRKEVEAAIEDMSFEGWEEIPEYDGLTAIETGSF